MLAEESFPTTNHPGSAARAATRILHLRADAGAVTERSPAWLRHPLSLVLAVGTAYWLGAQLGLALTFEPWTTSVLWPPNAILTSALLLVPPRRWWLCLLAALPAHLVLEIRAGFSPTLVALLFLTNCSEALIAATAMRAARAVPVRFDTLVRVVTFIALVGVLAPVLSSCADAAVVSVLRGQPYWDVWRMRVFSNVLTELSVVPAVILTFRALAGRRWRAPDRLLEGAGLVAGLTLVSVAVFGDLGVEAIVPGMPRTPTVLLLPLFFWAAVRFGAGGVSSALLIAVIVATTSTALGHRPFAVLPPVESLMAVQMYLGTIGMSLMCLSGVLEEKRRGAADLAERLRFESLVAQLAGLFVLPVPAAGTSAYEDGLPPIGGLFGADRVVLLTTRGALGPERVRQWAAADAPPTDLESRRRRLPWTRARVRSGQTIVFESLASLPRAARADRCAFAAAHVAAAMIVPVVTRAGVSGALAISSRRPRVWRDAELTQARVLAEVIANACARDEAELEVQRMRQELAQVARLVGMGELTASLAHELNQPLTGILSNAQAAARVLGSHHPSIVELRAIIGDIIDDDRRARDVIKRMRDMSTRTDAAPELLDLNALVRDVAMLITSDTIIRNVTVGFEFAAAPVYVTGIRIDLQQAVLNVLTNAMDGVAACDFASRRVEVRVLPGEADACLEVRDSGRGFEKGMEGRIFEPLSAMGAPAWGTGLAIARCIVESHGGTIAASNLLPSGALVTLVLPVAARQAIS